MSKIKFYTYRFLGVMKITNCNYYHVLTVKIDYLLNIIFFHCQENKDQTLRFQKIRVFQKNQIEEHIYQSENH